MDSTPPPPYKSKTTSVPLLQGSSSPKSEPVVRRRGRHRAASQLGHSPRRPSSDAAKPRRRRQSLLLVVPNKNPKNEEDIEPTFDRIAELLMWTHVPKSTLCFALGSLFFLSCCFSNALSFSALSVISKMAFLSLALSFFSNSVAQRNGITQQNRDGKLLQEEDIMRAAKVLLPFANVVISKTREVFSGQPCMTLKVAPLLLLGSEYGHLITLWRLCAIGFFLAFTVPKIYSTYSTQITQRVEWLSCAASETWSSCSHKKMVAVSVLAAFWNLSTIRTRILTAFISLVLFRYWRDQISQDDDDKPEPDCQQT